MGFCVKATGKDEAQKRSGFSLSKEATLSGRLRERKDDGTAWIWNPWLLWGGMTECGTTRAGRPQITGVPRVHRTLELDGRGTMGDNRLGCNGICPLPSLATIHGSPMTNGAKLHHHGTKSRLGGRLVCWIPAKARLKNRLASGAGDRRKNPMSLGQQFRKRKLRSTSHRRRIGSQWHRELVLCKREFPRLKNGLGPKGWRPARKMRRLTMNGRPSSSTSRRNSERQSFLPGQRSLARSVVY